MFSETSNSSLPSKLNFYGSLEAFVAADDYNGVKNLFNQFEDCCEFTNLSQENIYSIFYKGDFRNYGQFSPRKSTRFPILFHP